MCRTTCSTADIDLNLVLILSKSAINCVKSAAYPSRTTKVSHSPPLASISANQISQLGPKVGHQVHGQTFQLDDSPLSSHTVACQVGKFGQNIEIAVLASRRSAVASNQICQRCVGPITKRSRLPVELQVVVGSFAWHVGTAALSLLERSIGHISPRCVQFNSFAYALQLYPNLGAFISTDALRG